MKIVISLVFGFILACANQIEMTQKQQDDLGVTFQNVMNASQIKLGPYSATVALDKSGIISVSANVDVIVDKIYVQKFQHVKRGQALVRIKSNELVELQMELIQAVLDAQSTNKNFERDSVLVEDGIISQKRLLESKKSKKSDELKIKLLENKLRIYGFTNKEISQLKSNFTPITQRIIYASTSGNINALNVNIGSFVEAQQPMLELYSDKARFLDIEVPLQEIESVKVGTEVVFGTHKAKVASISSIVDTHAQSIEVRAQITSKEVLRVNEKVDVTLLLNQSGLFKIEKDALVFDEKKSYVFIKNNKGVEVVDVEVVREGVSCYIIRSDKLKTSDKVAFRSTSALLSAMEEDNE